MSDPISEWLAANLAVTKQDLDRYVASFTEMLAKAVEDGKMIQDEEGRFFILGPPPTITDPNGEQAGGYMVIPDGEIYTDIHSEARFLGRSKPHEETITVQPGDTLIVLRDQRSTT